MHKHNLQRLLWMLVVLACAGNAWAAQVTATFDFNSAESIQAMGYTAPTSSSQTTLSTPATINGVTFTPSTDNPPRASYYNSAYNLYFIKSSVFTLSVPTGSTITQVTFSGPYTSIRASVSTGTLSDLTWTGSSSSVTFTATSSNTVYTVAVTYTTTDSGTAYEPEMTDEFTFFPVMNNAASASMTITPKGGNTVYYTTNGTTPSKTNGTAVSTTTNLTLTGTTTVKAVGVSGTKTSSVVSRTYTLGQTVTGIGQFKGVASGTTVRLYIPDANNCRVTYVSEDGAEAYVRDNTGALYLDNVDANPGFKFNQHIAGWIVGKYVDSNGLPKFVADNTRTDTNCLVIADPVTESDVAPVEIEAADYSSHAADWVTTRGLHVNGTAATVGSESFVISNLYGLGTSDYYQTPYTGAIVDITGLAVPNASGRTLVPTYENGNRPLTYVVDESEDFTSPTTSISNARVRLVRELVSDQWQTLALPFAMSSFNGTILTPSTLSNGTLTFTTGRSTQAGKPYVVKPTSNVTEQTFDNVTLVNTAPTAVNNMTGMYKPTFMDGTTVTALAYKNGKPILVNINASELPATHAYFNSVGRLNLNGTYVSMYADVNLDGDVDVADINCIVNVIMGSVASGTYDGRDDLNGDGGTDVADINCAVNIIMGGNLGNDGLVLRAKLNTNNK